MSISHSVVDQNSIRSFLKKVSEENKRRLNNLAGEMLLKKIQNNSDVTAYRNCRLPQKIKRFQ